MFKETTYLHILQHANTTKRVGAFLFLACDLYNYLHIKNFANIQTYKASAKALQSKQALQNTVSDCS